MKRPAIHIPPPFAPRPGRWEPPSSTRIPPTSLTLLLTHAAAHAPLPLNAAHSSGQHAAQRARGAQSLGRTPVRPLPLVAQPPRATPTTAPAADSPPSPAKRLASTAGVGPDPNLPAPHKFAVLRATPISLDRADTLNKALVGGRFRDDDYVAAVTASILADKSDLAVRPPDVSEYTTLVAAGTRAIAARFATTTNNLDRSFWGKWSAYCRHVCGTPPLRSNQEANSNPGHPLHIRELNLALGAFLYWCLTEPQYKPASHMARLRGVVRYHRRAHLRFVDLSFVTTACKGIIRLLVKKYGPEVVAVRRKEPLEPWMIERWLALPDGTRVGPYVVGDNLPWLGVRVFITFECTSGCRKDDIAIDVGEVWSMDDLSLRFVHYRFNRVYYDIPTLDLLRSANTDTYSLITPPPGKSDFDGSRWGASPICSRWHPTDPINLARELVRYELARKRFTAPSRKLAPLLLNPSGECWRKQQLADVFKQLLLQIMPAAQASKYTIHSFRIYLACALRDMGVPNDVIKEIVRWASNEALALYSRANIETDAATRASAASATVDSIRTTSITSRAHSDTPLTDYARACALSGKGRTPSAFSDDTDHSRREAMVARALSQRSIDLNAPQPDIDSELGVFAAIDASASAIQRQVDRAATVDDHTDDEDD